MKARSSTSGWLYFVERIWCKHGKNNSLHDCYCFNLVCTWLAALSLTASIHCCASWNFTNLILGVQGEVESCEGTSLSVNMIFVNSLLDSELYVADEGINLELEKVQYVISVCTVLYIAGDVKNVHSFPSSPSSKSVRRKSCCIIPIDIICDKSMQNKKDKINKNRKTACLDTKTNVEQNYDRFLWKWLILLQTIKLFHFHKNKE